MTTKKNLLYRFLIFTLLLTACAGGSSSRIPAKVSQKEEQARKSRTDYVSHVFGTAKKYGLVPVYWDNGSTSGNGEKFGLFDRRTGLPNSPDSDALIKLMINAVK